jgi:ATP synthase protein I
MSLDGKDPGRGEISPEDRAALRKRAATLGSRLDQVKARREPQLSNAARSSALGQGFKIAVELVVGVVAGSFIGWALDRQFGTVPLFLIVFLILGFCAGMLNVIRSARRMQAAAEPLQRSAPSLQDDEDNR